MLQAIENQRLAGQIDYVVYSSDFPWWINVGSDIVKVMESLAGASPPATPSSSGKPATPPPNPPKPEWPIVLTGAGSPTGLTYLWQQAAGKLPAYFSPQSNRYMRLPIPEQNGGAAWVSAAIACTVRRAKWSPPADTVTSFPRCSA